MTDQETEETTLSLVEKIVVSILVVSVFVFVGLIVIGWAWGVVALLWRVQGYPIVSPIGLMMDIFRAFPYTAIIAQFYDQDPVFVELIILGLLPVGGVTSYCLTRNDYNRFCVEQQIRELARSMSLVPSTLSPERVRQLLTRHIEPTLCPFCGGTTNTRICPYCENRVI